jgi:hypothetical protein
MMTNKFGKKNFMPANGKAQHALMNGPVFFFLRGGRRERDFLFSSLFPSSSQSVAKYAPQYVPNSTPALSCMVLPKVQHPCIQTEKAKSRGAHLFLFCNWGSKEVLLLGHAQCSQKIADGPINTFKINKKVVSAPMN